MSGRGMGLRSDLSSVVVCIPWVAFQQHSAGVAYSILLYCTSLRVRDLDVQRKT